MAHANGAMGVGEGQWQGINGAMGVAEQSEQSDCRDWGTIKKKKTYNTC